MIDNLMFDFKAGWHQNIAQTMGSTGHIVVKAAHVILRHRLMTCNEGLELSTMDSDNFVFAIIMRELLPAMLTLKASPFIDFSG